MTNINKTSKYGRVCPICCGQVIVTCRCRLSDSTCINNHKWHYNGDEVHLGQFCGSNMLDHVSCQKLNCTPDSLKVTASDVEHEVSAERKMATEIEKAVVKGILDGFGSVSDVDKIKSLTSEAKKILYDVMSDSKGMSINALQQLAFHFARRRAIQLTEKKKQIKKNLEPSLKTEPILSPVPAHPLEHAIKYQQGMNTSRKGLIVTQALRDAFEETNLADYVDSETIDNQENWLANHFLYQQTSIPNQDLYDIIFNSAKSIAESIIAKKMPKIELELEPETERDPKREPVPRGSRADNKARKEEEHIKLDAESNRIIEAAKIELRELISKLLIDEGKNISSALNSALRYFKLIYLDGKKDNEAKYKFPGSSYSQRRRWLFNVVNILAPISSEDARKFISMRTRRKFASIYTICKFADAFEIFAGLERTIPKETISKETI